MKREIEARKRRFKFYRDEILKGGIIDWDSLYPGSRDLWEDKLLGEIAISVDYGREVSTRHAGTGDYPAVANNIGTSPIKLRRPMMLVDPNLIHTKKYCEYGDVLISAYERRSRTLGRNCVYLGSEKCIVGESVVIIKHNENPNFLSWTLSTSENKRLMKRMARGVTMLFLHHRELRQIPITLPPRPIQDLIAHHLDQLYEQEEQMEKELLAEIEYHNKQVQQIREELLEYGSDLWSTNKIQTIGPEGE